MENMPSKVPKFTKTILSKDYHAQELIIEALEYLDNLKKSGFAEMVSDFNYRLVLDEALENAISHGNCNDPDKNVSVTIEGYPEKVDIIIQDEGKGFCAKSIPDPRDTANQFAAHGRGLFLLSNIARISWNRTGNRLKIELSE
jgi:two-component sensor histidine kinase